MRERRSQMWEARENKAITSLIPGQSLKTDE
jgi:hypothetical protein